MYYLDRRSIKPAFWILAIIVFAAAIAGVLRTPMSRFLLLSSVVDANGEILFYEDLDTNENISHVHSFYDLAKAAFCKRVFSIEVTSDSTSSEDILEIAKHISTLSEVQRLVVAPSHPVEVLEMVNLLVGTECQLRLDSDSR